MKVKAYDIKWDDAPEDIDLPKSCTVHMDDDANPAEDLADILSNHFGWCVESCSYKILKENKKSG